MIWIQIIETCFTTCYHSTLQPLHSKTASKGDSLSPCPLTVASVHPDYSDARLQGHLPEFPIYPSCTNPEALWKSSILYSSLLRLYIVLYSSKEDENMQWFLLFCSSSWQNLIEPGKTSAVQGEISPLFGRSICDSRFYQALSSFDEFLSPFL